MGKDKTKKSKKEEEPKKKKSEKLDLEEFINEWEESASSLDEEELEEEKGKFKAGNNKGGFIGLDDDETIIRILPNKPGSSNKKQWIEVPRHTIRTEDKKFKSIICTEENCPICEAVRFLSTSTNSEYKKFANEIMAKKRYFFNAFKRKTNEVGILDASPQLASAIIIPINKNSGRYFGIYKGADFRVVKVKQKGKSFPTYEKSYFERDDSPLVKSGIKKDMSDKEKAKAKEIQQKKIKEILDKVVDLESMVKPPSEEMIEEFFSLLSEIFEDFAQDFEDWKDGNEPSSKKSKSSKKNQKVSDKFDDEDEEEDEEDSDSDEDEDEDDIDDEDEDSEDDEESSGEKEDDDEDDDDIDDLLDDDDEEEEEEKPKKKVKEKEKKPKEKAKKKK